MRFVSDLAVSFPPNESRKMVDQGDINLVEIEKEEQKYFLLSQILFSRFAFYLTIFNFDKIS